MSPREARLWFNFKKQNVKLPNKYSYLTKQTSWKLSSSHRGETTLSTKNIFRVLPAWQHRTGLATGPCSLTSNRMKWEKFHIRWETVLLLSKAAANSWFNSPITLWAECRTWPRVWETRRSEGLTCCAQSDGTSGQTARSPFPPPPTTRCCRLPPTFIRHLPCIWFWTARATRHLDHNSAGCESPWHKCYRWNAKTVFSCTALNSNHRGQHQSQNSVPRPRAENSSCP